MQECLCWLKTRVANFEALQTTVVLLLVKRNVLIKHFFDLQTDEVHAKDNTRPGANTAGTKGLVLISSLVCKISLGFFFVSFLFCSDNSEEFTRHVNNNVGINVE